MIACLLALALAQEPSPQPDEQAAVRQWLTQQYQEADKLLAEHQDDLAGLAQPPKPMLGLRLQIVDQGGQPPQRATMVSGILPGSPAAVAGIREGDRVVAIGSEPLDYESGKAVLLYLSNYSDAVPLTIERGSERRDVTLQWQVIPCLARANKQFPVAKWQQHFAKLRAILAAQGKDLATITTEQGFQLALDNLQKGSELGMSMLDNIATERALAMATACVPLNTP